MPLLSETIGSILDNWSDAVEGGNSYRGSGTKYWGIPSTRSHHEQADVTFAATADGTTTTVITTNVTAALAARLVRTDAPPFFLIGTDAGSNNGAARKITAHDGTSEFTVDSAFPVASEDEGVYKILEGFKRATDDTDFEADGTDDPSGHDRVFSFDMEGGKQLDWGGDGSETWESELVLRLRILKRAREQTARKAVRENIQNIASMLTGITARTTSAVDLRGDHTQSLSMLNGSIAVEHDGTKAVATVRFKIIYRFDATVR